MISSTILALTFSSFIIRVVTERVTLVERCNGGAVTEADEWNVDEVFGAVLDADEWNVDEVFGFFRGGASTSTSLRRTKLSTPPRLLL